MPEALWIFGYGSLIWDPGFTPAEACPARLDGWHRSFCMHSIHFRGTPAAPGLVLALDAAPGAACRGLALRAPAAEAPRILAEIRARELVSDAYLERALPVTLSDGRQVTAITYVIDRAGPQYCALDFETQAHTIARAHGARGPNRDYLFNTAAHLADLGLADPDLEALAARVRELLA
ncbi:gamma-glutamylcyclotransferase [Rhodobacter capsulatus]|jgi:cation transport protein ChaC|uniref:glutathione-specific gamma-glutamylcyclotransferase n=1 Tax=Rhodobacter capsulatus (strain ATCC BAA-309 / NBRC 16581 / SB1003) TaxID=272942 RepID=D5AQC3_RHOCB|nr:gamma-glutamylcyclotransferase [Rhodobacter capsulatus]ADE86712.1 cation transport protein ChaC [Rhodobacter capsulatus SB 1003]ETD00277.1 gamma-glutamyl cyclotransferase [Rhodobacter capsulatus DE442]ETD74617.1 gamma-glutamyl cyclotransferase [Rhodobacter capsulatus R121]ETE52481.1 gamma-glutamyl cyclotransferase [Rhodobacter capsulatus Y262]MDS0928513.1 gamma-glutamylcyclotransferase [Rhodobacter capsulatus]